MKREGKISSIVDKLGLSASATSQEMKESTARGAVCKMPFVVANYTPSDSGSESMGLERDDKSVKVISKTPIQAYDDQECLKYLNLTDEDPESHVSPQSEVKNDRV